MKYKNKANLILASNVFAHSDNLLDMAKAMLNMLKNDGTLVIEVQSLLSTLKDLTFDNIYHEHYNYWSLISLNNFFNKLNAKIINAEKINTHGGSIRIFVTKNNLKKVNKNVKKMLNEENNFGYLSRSKPSNYANRQECPKVYKFNGAFYLIKVKAFKKFGLHGIKKISKITMPEKRSIDIDTELDFKLAEFLAS